MATDYLAPGGMTTVDGGQMSGYTQDTSTVQPAPEQVVQPPQEPATPQIQLEEPTNSPTAISTDSMRDQLTEAEKQLNNLSAQIDAGAVPIQPQTTEQPKPEPTKEPLTPEDTYQTQLDQYNKETKALLDERKNEFNRYLTRSDTLLKSQVNSIQKSFDERRAQAEQVTANAKAASNVLGARTGRLRYAPEIQRGIITGQENALIKTLSTIDAMEAEAIAAAKQAAFDRDYTTFLDQIESLDAIKKDREKTLADLQAAMEEENEIRREEAEVAKYETQIIEQISAGITNPIELFTTLNGNVPFDLIKQYTDTLPEPASLDPKVLGSADLLVNPQTGEIIARGSKVGGASSVGQAVGYGAPVVSVGTPSIGGLASTYDSSTVEAQLMIDDIVNGLPTQLINNVAEIPRWREAVRKQLQAGYTPQQVIDKLSGFRLFEGSDKNLGTVLYNMATGTDLEPQELSSLINRGANEQAMTSVENAQLSNVNAFFAPVDKARATLKQAEAVLNILNDPAFPKDKLGAFDGRTFKIDRASGMTNQDTLKVQQLESALQLLNAPIRVEIVGTAATEAEMAKITGFQSEIIDQPEVVGTKVAELRDAVLRFHNEARQQRGLPTVEPSQLTNNSERLKLYRTLGNEEQKAVSSSLSNTDFLSSGSWSSATEEVKNLDNQSFFSRW